MSIASRGLRRVRVASDDWPVSEEDLAAVAAPGADPAAPDQ